MHASGDSACPSGLERGDGCVKALAGRNELCVQAAYFGIALGEGGLPCVELFVTSVDFIS
jgi:hypothetical protein